MTGAKKCEERSIPEDEMFPMIWAWVEKAHYHEFHDPRANKTYQAWSAEVRE